MWLNMSHYIWFENISISNSSNAKTYLLQPIKWKTNIQPKQSKNSFASYETDHGLKIYRPELVRLDRILIRPIHSICNHILNIQNKGQVGEWSALVEISPLWTLYSKNRTCKVQIGRAKNHSKVVYNKVLIKDVNTFYENEGIDSCKNTCQPFQILSWR